MFAYETGGNDSGRPGMARDARRCEEASARRGYVPVTQTTVPVPPVVSAAVYALSQLREAQSSRLLANV